jgi:hypothetical protein
MLYIALKPRTDGRTATGPNISESLLMRMEDALQFRVMGAVQAVIERRTEELEQIGQDDQREEESEESDEEAGLQQKRKKKTGDAKGEHSGENAAWRRIFSFAYTPAVGNSQR